ncbi:MAG: guanylate kinase [Planctomycetes bacterium]|nr:guanylate kinase [Planctomycetota bacterium]
MNEKTAKEEKGSSRRGRLFVISGPSGVGKSTVTRQVLKRTGAAFSISVTTRPRRQGEVDGRDYLFVDDERFRRMIGDDALLEWAEVFGHYYGTPAEPVEKNLAAGKKVLLEIDVQGGRQIAGRCPDAVLILLVPPGGAELGRRLSGRGTESPAAAASRLAKAEEEIRLARESGAYTYEVVNDDLDETVNQVAAIVEEESCL